MSDFIHKFTPFARSITICIYVLLALVDTAIRDVTTVPHPISKQYRINLLTFEFFHSLEKNTVF